jgi:archaeal type IV pilus assembly protein PilA
MIKKERAVSSVIGIILVVAITVLIAAIIGTFVFGMGGNTQKSRIVGISVEQISNNILSFTNMGGKDVDSLTGLVITGVLSNGTKIDADYIPSDDQRMINLPPGSMNQFIMGTPGEDHVIVTGYFIDGQSQILLDTTV